MQGRFQCPSPTEMSRGGRIYVPVRAEFTAEHERGSDDEEIEFQLKWRHDEESDQPEDDDLVV